ncbi:MAG: Jag N-terminal domain-containing protein [Ruminococcus sp.]|nr:Jag N-terminal domain-containing protein [Ruminococcus sp.]
MEVKEIFHGSSIEEAKKAACEKLGLQESQIVFKILEEPKKSLFGKIKRDAQVEAIFEKPDEPEAKPVAQPVVEKKPAAAEPKDAPVPAENQPTKMAEPKQAAPAPKGKGISTAEEKLTEKKEKPVYDNSPGIEAEPVEEILTEEMLPENLKVARQYVVDIYHNMGIEVTVETTRTKSGIRMELSSDTKSGTIIGRRGETLDYIQYLASIIANKIGDDYCRLMLDSNGYRTKRRKTLEMLAEKIARNVQRSGRATTLEPMNPYERRIIHSRISEIEGVISRSVGEDPYRKVVISSVGGRRNYNNNYRGRNNQRYNQGQNRNGKRNYRERDQRKPEDFKRSNLDNMKTSFERDYKKPKPEDEINAGLYGKIDF